MATYVDTTGPTRTSTTSVLRTYVAQSGVRFQQDGIQFHGLQPDGDFSRLSRHRLHCVGHPLDDDRANLAGIDERYRQVRSAMDK